MESKHLLSITWGKAFDEIYCHHASLSIPYHPDSLFAPEYVRIGITIRTNIIKKKKIDKSLDAQISKYLPCALSGQSLIVALNDTAIVDALCLNSWSSLKNNKRGTPKQIPVNISYSIDGIEEFVLPFDIGNNGTPYLMFEKEFESMANGDKIDTNISL